MRCSIKLNIKTLTVIPAYVYLSLPLHGPQLSHTIRRRRWSPVIPARHPCQHKQLNITTSIQFSATAKRASDLQLSRTFTGLCNRVWDDIWGFRMIFYLSSIYFFFILCFLIYCPRSDSSALVIWQKVTGSHMPFHCAQYLFYLQAINNQINH